MRSMFTPRNSHGICYMDKLIYVAGGITNDDDQPYTELCECYDIEKNWYFFILLISFIFLKL